jgi:hypothetical protein
MHDDYELTRSFAQKHRYATRGGPEAVACLGGEGRQLIVPCLGGRIKNHPDQPWRIGSPRTYLHVLGNQIVITGLCSNLNAAVLRLASLTQKVPPSDRGQTRTWGDGEWEARFPLDRWAPCLEATFAPKKRKATAR